MEYRIERDSMGEVRVPEGACWGAQTQRSLENFKIGAEKQPLGLIKAIALIKWACAQTNLALGRLDERRAGLIFRACGEIARGELDSEFPLTVWQTGSGTQTNMNVNEVIAHRANELAGERLLHPNDHVNMSQSTNDVYPSAIHAAAVMAIEGPLFSALDSLCAAFRELERENAGVIKTGRTHLQDATPIAFSQEISGWRAMLERDRGMLDAAVEKLRSLALGGTAVGTGLNAPEGFGELAAERLSALAGTRFESAANKFQALSSKDELVFAHGALKALAADYMKLANDVRWLASGPRCGLGEITIPENEPGSSIMPGKVNPTQCESAAMVAVQVMANDVAVGLAASQGSFELNVFMPLIAYDFLQSAGLLADSMASFERNCARGIKADRGRMKHYLDNSLMLVTALSPKIGYESAARAADYAHKNGVSLREACETLGIMSAEEFDRSVRPEDMV